MSLQSRSRRYLPAGATVALVALLGFVVVPAATAAEVVIVPTPTGTDVTVSATVDGTLIESTFGEVVSAGDTYLETVALEDYDLSPFPATSDYVFVVSSSADWTGSSIVTCLSYDPADVDGDPAFFVRTYDGDTDSYTWIDRTTSIPTPGTICGLDDWATYSGEYILGFTPSVGNVDLPVVTSEYEISLTPNVGTPFGGEPGPYLDLEIVNPTTSGLRVGFGVDLQVQGDITKLWLPSSWGTAGDSGIVDIFSASIPAGDTFEMELPDWPGRTYNFYLLPDDVGPADEGVLVGQSVTSGRFVPMTFDFSEDTEGNDTSTAVLGIEASVTGGGANSELFPGVTATVGASGLVPGEELELWLAPGLDYFYFYVLGATLPSDAINVGTGIVGPDGVLSTTFEIPDDADLTYYQLIVGDPVERYWPAGSYSSFNVTLPSAADTVSTPQGAAVEVTLDLDSTGIELLFPSITTLGATTVAASTTGPVFDSFLLTSSPQIYYHIDTTATFSGLVQVCITYDPLTLTGGIPYLYHYADLGAGGYQWQNITSSRAAGLVCGLTDSFSPFTLGYSSTPEVILTNKNQCKNGGWAASTLPIFKNQGDCVSYFAAPTPDPKHCGKGGHGPKSDGPKKDDHPKRDGHNKDDNKQQPKGKGKH